MKFNDFLKLASRPRKRHNKALILALATRMRRLRHEDHYEQSDFYRETACGATGCLALHTLIAAGASSETIRKIATDKNTDLTIWDAATNLLGLRGEEHTLFGVGVSWPEPYASRLRKARFSINSDELPSRVAADLLEAVANGKVKVA